MSLATPSPSVELLREQCNRLVSGQCGLRKCLVRGGWVGGEVNYDKATCEYREAVAAMEEVERLRQALRIIAGLEQCADNLMGNADVARATLGQQCEGPIPKVAPLKPLPVEVANLFPDGTVDKSTYPDIEDALDRADAPATADAGRWLSLPERIDFLAAAIKRLKTNS